MPSKVNKCTREQIKKVQEWQAAHPGLVKANNRKQRERYKAVRPDYHLAAHRKHCGLPEPTRPCPEFCECCGGPPGKKRLALDHCHETGRFRGWLCGKCNAGMGLLGDTVDGVRLAVKYLLSH